MHLCVCHPGVWETKVSNREKRQQRRKEKGPEDSGGSGSVEASKTHVEATVPAAVNKRNRGNHGIHVEGIHYV